MSSYTEENLGKLLKKDLIAIILAMQSKMPANSDEVLEEIRKCPVFEKRMFRGSWYPKRSWTERLGR